MQKYVGRFLVATVLVFLIALHARPSYADEHKKQWYKCEPGTIVGLGFDDVGDRWIAATFDRIETIELSRLSQSNDDLEGDNSKWEFYRGDPRRDVIGEVCAVGIPDHKYLHCSVLSQFTFSMSLESLRFQMYQDGGFVKKQCFSWKSTNCSWAMPDRKPKRIGDFPIQDW